ncbi:MAG: radical SAM protein [Candidatus Sumerlaeota bacterium]
MSTPSPYRKVLCAVPPTGKFIREDRCQTPIERLKTVALRSPIDLMYAAGAFQAAGLESKLVDYPAEDLVWADMEKDLREFQPDIVVLSITTPSLDQDLKAADLAKKLNPNVITVAKGAHFNTLDVQTLEKWPSLDLALRGEYEETCEDIARGKPFAEIKGLTWRDHGVIRRNDARLFPNDLDRIAFPARNLTHNNLYIRPDTGEMQTTIITNRGCPFSCSYCLANQVSGLKNRYRGVENVIAEIKECVNVHGIRNFLFRSDLFTQNKKWVIELCNRIVEEKLDIQWASNSRVDTITPEALEAMKRAGCWVIAFGVEKGTNEALAAINKKATIEQAKSALEMTRAAGIKRSIYILIGLPDDDIAAVNTDIEFAKELDPDFLEIFYPYPFPGTPLYRDAVAAGLLKDGTIPLEAYGLPCMPTKHLTMEQLAHLRTAMLRKFYMRPSYIARTLGQTRSPRELANYVKYGFAQLKQIVIGA